MSDFPCPFCEELVPGGDAAAAACPHCQQSIVVCEHFRIEALLGRGGMGAVYAARHQRDGRVVAVKLMTLAAADWKSHELFERGSRVLMNLEHELLPEVHGFTADEETGRLLLVREAFDGGTLAERMTERGMRPSPEDFHHLFERALELLDYLHTRIPPVIHRDLKPANIMFRGAEDWEPVLVDFDTVSAFDASKGDTIVGTPGYTAPEQFTGESSAVTDLYSLGATLVFVATGQPPSELPRRGGRLDIDDRLAPLLAADRRVLLQLLEARPEERPQSAREALDALRGATEAAPEPTAAPAPAPAEPPLTAPEPRETPQTPATKAPRRRRGRVLMILLALLVVGGGVALWWYAPTLFTLSLQPQLELDAHPRRINALAIAGAMPVVATGGDDGMVRYFGVDDSKAAEQGAADFHQPLEIGAPVQQLAFSPGAQYLAVSAGRGSAGDQACHAPIELRVYRAREGELLHRVEGLGCAPPIAFHPERPLLAMGVGEHILLIDVEKWRIEASLVERETHDRAIALEGDAIKCPGANHADRCENHHNRIPYDGMAFSPDGRHLAANYRGDNHILVWDVRAETYQRESTITKPSVPGGGAFRAIAFSPDNRTLALASDSVGLLIDVASGELLQELRGHHEEVTALAFHPEDALIATGSRDGRVRLFSTDRGQLRGEVRVEVAGRAQELRVDALAFSRHGERLVAGGEKGIALVYKIR